jgi:rhodanese-related sulfurtransferase
MFRDKEVAVYCHNGKSARNAEELLRRAGFKRVIHVKGDMEEWLKKGYPIAYTDGEEER